jgi:hypothetical protein
VARRLGKKIRPSFEKVAKTIAEPKIAQIPITKLNLKGQKFYIKPLLTPKNTNNKPYFETAYLGENVKKIAKAKSTQKCCYFWGYFIFSKCHIRHPKVAQ